MRTETEHTIFLKDYAPTPYSIDKVELDVRIFLKMLLRLQN